jgi:tRNA(fMet)-specific endonuclease VapC
MLYLLDTNILSDLIRNPQGRVAERIVEVGEASVCTSIIVAAELRFGATRRKSERLTAQMELILGTIPVLSFETPADAVYGEVRASLEAAGTPIGANDMLIAAHGLSLGCTVITDNEREFARVVGLEIENWLRSSREPAED